MDKAQAQARLAEIELELQMAQLDQESDEKLLKNQAKEQAKVRLGEIEKEIAALSQPEEPQREAKVTDPLMDLVAGVNQAGLTTADFLTAPMRATGEFITGQDVRSPTEWVNQEIGRVGTSQGTYTPDEALGQWLQLAGEGLGMAATLKPVVRNPGDTSSIVADVLGAGSSQAPVEYGMAAKLGDMPTAFTYDTFEDLYKEAKPIMERKAAEYVNQNAGPVTSKVQKEFTKQTAKELGVSLREINEAARSIDGGFGVKGKSIDELVPYKPEDYQAANVALGKDANSGFGAWYGKYVRPIVYQMEKKVGKTVAGRTQRLATESAKYNDYMKGVFHTTPVRAFSRAIQNDDGSIRQALLNMSNQRLKLKTRKQAEQDVITMLLKTGNNDAYNGFMALRKVLMDQQKRTQKYVDATLKPDELYWPSQVKGTQISLPGQKMTRVQRQQNMKEQKRGKIKSAEEAMEYESPDVVLDDMLRGAFNVSDLHRQFNLPNLGAKAARQAVAEGKKIKPKKMRQHIAAGNSTFDELVQALQKEGASEEAAMLGRNMLESIITNGPRGPNKWVSNFRKAAYMGTIGNPYSAVLNVGDTFNSMLNFGVRNTAASVVDSFRNNGARMGVEDIGLANQATGEFLRDGVTEAQRRFDMVSDTVFKYSGFQGIDRWGKGVAMNAALKNNKKLAEKGLSEFSDKWKHAFTPAELRQLHADVKAGKKTKLTTELAAAELSRLQPTDVAALPQWYLDNPNWRVLYMLRTFGIKQLQQMEKLILDQWKKGGRENKINAVKNALAYAVIVGGGNAMVQEGRQAMKGNGEAEFSPESLGMRWADHMLGSLSANGLSLYNLGRSVNEKNPVYLASGVVPPITMAFAPIVDAGQAAKNTAEGNFDFEEALDDSEVIGWLPFGRLAQSWLGEE